jgi:hypothetical protein
MLKAIDLPRQARDKHRENLRDKAFPAGIPYWTSDVGGFSGTPTPELAARWHQFGSVCPLYRSHGMTPREPWAYGAQAEASIVKSITLRKTLHPYIMQLAVSQVPTAASVPACLPACLHLSIYVGHWHIAIESLTVCCCVLRMALLVSACVCILQYSPMPPAMASPSCALYGGTSQTIPSPCKRCESEHVFSFSLSRKNVTYL